MVYFFSPWRLLKFLVRRLLVFWRVLNLELEGCRITKNTFLLFIVTDFLKIIIWIIIIFLKIIPEDIFNKILKYFQHIQVKGNKLISLEAGLKTHDFFSFH